MLLLCVCIPCFYKRTCEQILILLIQCIAGGIGIGVYISHKNTSHDGPTALGGSAGEKLETASSAAVSASGDAVASTTSLHVSPTHTVARRDAFIPGAVATPSSVPRAFLPLGLKNTSHMVRHDHAKRSLRHKREDGYLNRID